MKEKSILQVTHYYINHRFIKTCCPSQMPTEILITDSHFKIPSLRNIDWNKYIKVT